MPYDVDALPQHKDHVSNEQHVLNSVNYINRAAESATLYTKELSPEYIFEHNRHNHIVPLPTALPTVAAWMKQGGEHPGGHKSFNKTG